MQHTNRLKTIVNDRTTISTIDPRRHQNQRLMATNADYKHPVSQNQSIIRQNAPFNVRGFAVKSTDISAKVAEREAGGRPSMFE